MSMVVKHAIASGLVLTLCVVFFIQSLNYPTTAAKLPQILIVIIAILGIMMSFEALKKHKETNAKSEEKEETEKVIVKRVFIFIAMIALYILLMDTIGYFILTPLFTFATLIYLKATNVVVAIILSIAFASFIYVLFSMFLHVPIPTGIFF